MILIASIILNLIFCLSSFAEEDHMLEKIVVTGNSGSVKTQNYPAETFSYKDIQGKKLTSAPDVFKYASGVDLRYRGT